MTVKRNIHFSILIKIEGRLREFNFRQRSEHLYDADVSDERGMRHLFTWCQENTGWQLVPKSSEANNLPLWLINNVGSIREGFLTEAL